MSPADTPQSDDFPLLIDRRHEHNADRLRISGTLKSKGGRLGLRKKTSNLFRHRDPNREKIVDLSAFNRILSLDGDNLSAEIEGMATFDAITTELLPFGYMPPVVPELKTITLGGAVTGIGLESSSFKFGFVHETVLEMDIATATGDVIHCTPNGSNADLHFGFPNSYGTLGYALRLKIPLVQVKPSVHIQHHRFETPEEFLLAMETAAALGHSLDFVEGVCFSPSSFVLTTGKFCEKAPFHSDYTGEAMYFQSLLKKQEDYLSTYDYLWRWDTDWFWCSKHFGAQNKWIRPLFPRHHLGSSTYWKIRNFSSRTGISRLLNKKTSKKESVIQDVEIPLEHCEQFLRLFLEEIPVQPLWICPVRTQKKSDQYPLYSLTPEKLFLNFGFWDTVPTFREVGYYNRRVESMVAELNGKKTLYSDVFYEEGEFWKQYGGNNFKILKKKYDPANALPSLYEKCAGKK